MNRLFPFAFIRVHSRILPLVLWPAFTLALLALPATAAPRMIRQFETSEIRSQRLDLLRGETVTLDVRFLNYGAPLSLAGAAVTLHAQTNGMAAGASWQTAGTAGIAGDASSASNGWASVAIPVSDWLPETVTDGTWTLEAAWTNPVLRVLRAGGPLTVAGTAAADSAATPPVTVWTPITNALVASFASLLPSGGWRNEEYWYIDIEARPRSVASTLAVTNRDAIIYYDTVGAGLIDWQVSPLVLRGFPSAAFTYSVSGTAATIDQAGLLTMLSPGQVTVTLSNAVAKSVDVDLYLSTAGATSLRPGVDRLPGSAAYVATTNIDSRLAAGGSDTYWLTNNPTLGIHVRNPASWAADADLSGVAVSTSGGSVYWHGTAISTQHILMVKHAYNGVGAGKRFVGRSGTLYNRTITALYDPYPGVSFWAGDWVVGRLDSPLPASDVAVYPVLPVTYTNQFPTAIGSVPALIYNQAQQVKVGDLTHWMGVTAPVATNRLAHYSLPYSGDSGRPTFLWLDEGLVYLFLFTTAQSGVNSPLYFRARMNEILAADGAALTDLDLSSYTGVWP